MNNFEGNPYSPCSAETPDSECAELARALYEFVDGRGDAATRERLQRHAEQCPSCLEALGVEQQVREILRASCTQPAPMELRTKISRQLRVMSSDGNTSYSSVTEYTEIRREY